MTSTSGGRHRSEEPALATESRTEGTPAQPPKGGASPPLARRKAVYRGVVSALLEEDPDLVLPAIRRVLASFQMPGTAAIPEFGRRALAIAKSGVYNLRVHHDKVIAPLLRDFGIEERSDLSPAAARAQEELLGLSDGLLRCAEVFERRYGPVTT